MKDNDHKKLGRKLKIYLADDDIGRGLPLWLPHGAAVREELEKLLKELEFKAGYDRVVSPHLARESLYAKSGHLAYYDEHMYPAMKVDESEVYRLKPMNCPHHHRIFASQPRSYRDLPVRLAEFGQVYRLEDSGALSGLLRVRGLCQNDAHIYCSREQVKDELKSVLRMHLEVYRILRIESFRLRLSLWDPCHSKKYVDNPEAWNWSQDVLRQAMTELGLEFEEGHGEAAFYGPKIDVQLKSAGGREETFSTVQVDFSQSESMDLSYVGSDGKSHRPIIIHRAPLGSHERMMAFLLELYEGHWPLWLAPVQVKILPVNGKAQGEASRALCEKLRSRMIRAECDLREESLDYRLREAIEEKAARILVVGRREIERGEVSVRIAGKRESTVVKADEFIARLLGEISSRE